MGQIQFVYFASFAIFLKPNPQNENKLQTPPRMPTPTIPDTPVLSSDELIPDTPNVLEKTKSARTPKMKAKPMSQSPMKPSSPKVSAPSTPAKTPLQKVNMFCVSSSSDLHQLYSHVYSFR